MIGVHTVVIESDALIDGAKMKDTVSFMSVLTCTLDWISQMSITFMTYGDDVFCIR